MNRIKAFLRHNNNQEKSKIEVRPSWFSYETCYRAIKQEPVDLTILIDGTADAHHIKFINEKVIEFVGGDDASSLLFALRYIESCNFDDDDIIYIIEGDFLHAPMWSSVLIDAFNTFDVDYVTLYDHPDKYFLSMYDNLESKILVSEKCHWRATPSTVNTYAAKWKTFKKHWDKFHIHYCLPEITHGGYDHTKFTELWKSGSNLISSIPGYSTHCHIPYLSPVVNWELISREI